MGIKMPNKNSFEYQNAFKNTLSPCYSSNGKQINKAGWHAGGRSMFELYTGLKKNLLESKGGKKKNRSRSRSKLRKVSKAKKNRRRSGVRKARQRGGNYLKILLI